MLNCVGIVFDLRDDILGNFCLETNFLGVILNSGGGKLV